MESCKHNEDEGNYHRARKLHDEEARMKTSAITDADEEYLALRREFISNNWGMKDISDLEKMLEKSDLMVEKGRFLDDSELVYHGAELSNEIVGVVNNLKNRRSRLRKAKIGLGVGIALTAFTLIQPYTPTEPVQEKAKEAYHWIKEKIVEIRR